MKSLYLSVLGITIPCAFALTGCTDDDYDLSDLDKTAQIPVNDLTVPVNIDEIYLSDIIDVKPGDRVQIVDGGYAVVEENTFNSDPIEVDDVTLSSPMLESSTRNISLDGAATLLESGQPLLLPLGSDESAYDLTASDVSAYIVSVKEVDCDLKITIALSLNGFGDKLKSMSLRNVVLGIPKGLGNVTGNGRYSAESGEFHVTDSRINGTKAEIEIAAKKLDFIKCGAVYNADAHTMKFADKLKVISGEAVITASDFTTTDFSTLPSYCTYRTDFDLSRVYITGFSGRIRYDLTSFDIPQVDLTDLPDVLSQPGTDIKLVNPCLYLRIENPVSAYSLHAVTGFEIKALREGQPTQSYSLPAPFTVTSEPESEYCLSPTKPSEYLTAFANSQHIPFPSLGNIFSGDGLPQSLDINLINPELPEQEVTGFKLGHKLGSVHGSYYFFAPIELGAGSKITYSDVLDGWSSEDLDKVTISRLHVTASVTTDVPVSLKFSAYPIDKDGNQINDVEIDGGYVDASAIDQQLDINITGTVTGLAGIRFTAVAAPKPGEDASALRPGMNIKLSKIRATVSGYYLTTL